MKTHARQEGITSRKLVVTFQPLIIDKIIRGPDLRLPRLDEPELIMLLDGGVDDLCSGVPTMST